MVYFPICPRVTPSWLNSFNSRQSCAPVISPRSSWRYCAIVCVDLLRRFVQKFDAEMAHAQRQHPRRRIPRRSAPAR